MSSRHGKDPMDAVATVRTSREADAAARLAHAEQHLQLQQQRAAELQQYLRDYEGLQPPGSARLMANRAGFIARLREAVTAQQQQLRAAERGCDDARQRYLLARQDVKVMDRLRAHRESAEAHVRRRDGEKAMDEWLAQRLFVTAS